MVAVPLIFGHLTAADYEDSIAADPRIDVLRAKIVCAEDAMFSQDYLDPEKRSIANAMTVMLNDGTALDELVIEYPVGHMRRRAEGLPLLEAKFARNLTRRFDEAQAAKILQASDKRGTLEAMPVCDYVDLYAVTA